MKQSQAQATVRHGRVTAPASCGVVSMQVLAGWQVSIAFSPAFDVDLK
ncbi:hypothetical protein [Pseudomonas sp. NPDC086278]